MKHFQTNDAILVSQYISGDEKAIELLIHRYKHYVYSFIYSKVLDRDTTEDIFQDTFIKVIKSLKKGKYNEEGKFLPWVMRIAHNLVIDFFRKSKRLPKFNGTDEYDVFSLISDTTLNAEKKLIKDQIETDVAKLIHHLPEEQKQVLVMRIYKDMSFKDIAELTGVSINTSLGRMRYALLNLRKLVEEKQIILTS